MRPPRVLHVCQHESHSLDGSHKPLSAENAKLPALADLSCLVSGLAGCCCVIWLPGTGAIKGADNMMGKSANEIIRKCVLVDEDVRISTL